MRHSSGASFTAHFRSLAVAGLAAFATRSLYETAIEEVCRPDFAGVRRLVAPEIVGNATVRGGP